MDVTINARHCSVPDSLRNQATQRLNSFQRLDRRATAATLVFDGAPNGWHVEARLAVAGGPPLVARADGATLRSAMDGALDRLQRQLKRQRERLLDRRSRQARPRQTTSPR
jgi:ribosomal subunit interface protein